MRVIGNFGLVEVDSAERFAETNGYSMHSCVHDWTRAVLNPQFRRELAELALDIVVAHVPKDDNPRSSIVKRRLEKHSTTMSLMALNLMVNAANNADIAWVADNITSLARDLDIVKLPTFYDAHSPEWAKAYVKSNRMMAVATIMAHHLAPRPETRSMRQHWHSHNVQRIIDESTNIYNVNPDCSSNQSNSKVQGHRAG